MKVAVEPQALRKIAAWEYAVRFAFGGTISAVAGMVAHAFGPVIGGLFLAFPAILPATMTLVKRHDGREDASDDALGASTGSIGLAVFALCVWLLSARWSPALVLAAATVGWLVVSVVVWAVTLGRRSQAGTGAVDDARGA